jgi:hypothetical protein
MGLFLLQTSLAAAAPFVGPSKKEVLGILKSSFAKKKLPLTLGSGEPKAVIDFSDGMWSIRRLVSNPKKQAEIQKKQEKEGNYMPEHDFMALEAGEAIIKDKDKKLFIKKIEALSWNF